jgi:hypothetical protein
MNYLFFNSKTGQTGELSEISMRMILERDCFYHSFDAIKLLGKVKVGQYFHAGHIVIVGTIGGISIKDFQ